MTTFEPLVRRRRLVLALYLLTAAAAAPGLLRLEIDNAPEGFFVRDAGALADYRHFEAVFGGDRGLRLVVTGDLWTADGLRWLRRLEEDAEKIRGVRWAAGLYRHHRWRLDSWPPADVDAFRTEVLADPIDRNAGWTSSGGDTVTVLAGLYRLGGDQEREVLERLERLLATAPEGVAGRLVGLPAVRRAFDRELVAWLAETLPLLVLLAVALLALAYRQTAAVAAPLALVGLCQVVLFGAMGHAGQRFDFVIMVLVPVHFVVTLATAVHVVNCYRDFRRSGRGAAAAVADTYRVKAWPVVWTGVTTGAGFGSLAVSPVPPLRALGVWSAFGIAFTTLAALSFLPALLATLERPPSPAKRRFEPWARRRGRGWAELAIRRRWTLYALAALAAAAAVAGLPRLRTETGVLTYFPARHPLRATVEDLERGGIGVAAAELVLRAGDGSPSFDDPDTLVALARLSERLRSLPGALTAVGPGDVVDGVIRYLPAGDDPRRRARETVDRVPELRRFLAALISADGREARVSVQVPMRGFGELEPVFGRIAELARELFPAAEATITGRYPLVVALQKSLLQTLWLSLSLTALVIAVLFRLVLAGSTLGARLLLPNLWPVLLVLGAMGWLGIAVDSTTVMIAAAVLGLVVDDTLHTVGWFRRLAHLPDAAAATLERTAGAHLLTSVVLAAGFGICALSKFLPVANFGMLTAFGIVTALVADLLWVPALLANPHPNPSPLRE